MEKFDVLINFVKAAEETPVNDGTGVDFGGFISAQTGDFGFWVFALFAFLATATYFLVFLTKNKKFPFSIGSHVSKGAFIYAQKNKIAILGAFLIALCGLSIFGIVSAQEFEFSNTPVINGYVHNDGRIDFDKGSIACSKDNPLEFSYIEAQYSLDVYDKNTKWTIKLDDNCVYDAKIPGQNTADFTFNKDIQISLSIDQMDAVISQKCIGNTVVSLSFYMNSSGPAKFDREPELTDDFDFLGTTPTKLISDNGQANLGTIMYKMSTNNTKPSSEESAWTSNSDEINAYAVGTYYVWAYVKGSGDFTDSEVLDLGSVTISQADRDFEMLDPLLKDQWSFIFDHGKDKHQLDFKIRDFGGAQNSIEVSGDYTACLTIDSDLSKSAFMVSLIAVGSKNATFTLKDNNGYYKDQSFTVDISVSDAGYKVYTDPEDGQDYALLYTFGDCGEVVSFTVPETVQLKKDEGSELKTYQVKKIGDGENCVFESSSQYIKSVILNPNITEIADKAFENSKIKELMSCSNLEIIGKDAFYRCESLNGINKDFGFNGMKSLKSIGDSAFVGCSSTGFRKVDLSACENSPTIGIDAFNGCMNVSSVKFNDSITEIGPRAFFYCGLGIHKNRYNLIFDDSQKYLLDGRFFQYPDEKGDSFTIGNKDDNVLSSVRVIAGAAFGDDLGKSIDANKIKKIIIDNKKEGSTDALYINDQAFTAFSNLSVFLAKDSAVQYINNPFKDTFANITENKDPIFTGILNGDDANIPELADIEFPRAKRLNYVCHNEAILNDTITVVENEYFYLNCENQAVSLKNIIFGNKSESCFDMNGHQIAYKPDPTSSSLVKVPDLARSYIVNSTAGSTKFSTSKNLNANQKFCDMGIMSCIKLYFVQLIGWNKNSGSGSLFNFDKTDQEVCVFDSNIQSNSASNGGCFYVSNSAKIFIANCYISDNKSNYGGFICSKKDVTESKIDVLSCNFVNNYAKDQGGVFYTNGFLSVCNSIFNYNYTNNGSSQSNGSIVAAFNKSNISFTDCQLSNCGRDKDSSPNIGTKNGGAIFLDGSDDPKNKSSKLELENCIFNKSIAFNCGGDIWAIYTNLNIVGCQFLNSFAKEKGGSIICDNVVFNMKASKSPNKNDEVNSLFNGCSCETSGGAFYASNCIGNDSGDISFYDTTFESCKVSNGDGGAVCCYNCQKVNFDSCVAQNCVADDNGGCFCVTKDISQQCDLKISGTFSFYNNEVSDDKGGAIYSDKQNVLISGTGTFSNNKSLSSLYGDGGAIYINEAACSVVGNSVNERVSFLSNSSCYSGGAICLIDKDNTHENTSIILNNVVFNKNKCADSGKGGAIYSKTSITAENCDFTDNTSVVKAGIENDGGAIYVNMQSYKTLDYAKLFFKKCNFDHNSCTDYGGAICANTVNSLTINSCDFSDNSSEDSGGAIWARNIQNFQIKGIDKDNHTSFYNNTTSSSSNGEGGAIYTQKCTLSIFTETITDDNRITFYNNKSDNDDGGAIFVSDGSIMIKNALFDYNSADNEGGALCLEGSSQTAQILENCVFSNNHTKSSTDGEGGAIYVHEGYALVITGTAEHLVKFEHNYTKSDDGGAIYFDMDGVNSDCKFTYCCFTKNAAQDDGYGGAIFVDAERNRKLLLYYCEIRDNKDRRNDSSKDDAALACDDGDGFIEVDKNTCSGDQLSVYNA